MTITKSSTRRLGAVLAVAGLAVSLAACGAGAKQAGVADIGTTTTTAAAPAATGGTRSSPGQAAAEIEKIRLLHARSRRTELPGPEGLGEHDQARLASQRHLAGTAEHEHKLAAVPAGTGDM